MADRPYIIDENSKDLINKTVTAVLRPQMKGDEGGAINAQPGSALLLGIVIKGAATTDVPTEYDWKWAIWNTTDKEFHESAVGSDGDTGIGAAVEDPAAALLIAAESDTGVVNFLFRGFPGIPMMLTNATAIAGHVNAWKYTGAEAIPGIDGFWTVKTGGKTSTKIFNGIEANNSATGVQGCGVDVDNLPAGWEIKPLGGDGATGQPVVMCYPMKDCSDPPEDIYVFFNVNVADGECDGSDDIDDGSF